MSTSLRVECKRCGQKVIRSHISKFSGFCNSCDPNTPLSDLQRERMVTAVALSQRSIKRAEQIKRNAIPLRRRDQAPFRRNSLILKFFDRAMRPQGLKLKEMMIVCHYVSYHKNTPFTRIFKKLMDGITIQGWTWDLKLEDKTLYIFDVKLLGHGQHTYPGTEVPLTNSELKGNL